MTTTKEDQIYAAFKTWANSQGFTDSDLEDGLHELPITWKACAESYEQKLAEKDAVITNLRAYAGHERSLGAEPFAIKLQSVEQQLSEANARNAMLIKAVTALTGVCITQVGADYNDTIHAAYILGRDAIAANKGKEVV